MTKEDTPLPLLSDEQINRMSGDPIAAQAVSSYEFGKVIGMGRGLAAGRNFYEPHILSRDAKIKSLENEVARLQGATNFETVPKEAYDRLEGLAQELVNSAKKMGVDAREVLDHGSSLITVKAGAGRIIITSDAAISSAKALGFQPKNPQ